MRRIKLRWAKIQDCSRPRKRICGDEKKNEHLPQPCGVEEACKLLRRNRASFRFPGAFGFRRHGAEDMRNFADFLPLARPIERSPIDSPAPEARHR